VSRRPPLGRPSTSLGTGGADRTGGATRALSRYYQGARAQLVGGVDGRRRRRHCALARPMALFPSSRDGAPKQPHVAGNESHPWPRSYLTRYLIRGGMPRACVRTPSPVAGTTRLVPHGRARNGGSLAANRARRASARVSYRARPRCPCRATSQPRGPVTAISTALRPPDRAHTRRHPALLPT
jgi:hypothetical protein